MNERRPPAGSPGLFQLQEQLGRLDDLQQRHDALERKLAALEHGAPRQSAVGPASSGPTAEGSAGISPAPAEPAAAASTAAPEAAVRSSGSRPYRASDYGGRGQEQQESLEAQLLERDVRLFDLTLVGVAGGWASQARSSLSCRHPHAVPMRAA